MESLEDNNKRVFECSYQWSLPISDSSLTVIAFSKKNSKLRVLNFGKLTGERTVENSQGDDQKVAPAA